MLVLALQARELAEHARVANEVAGAESNRELLRMAADVHRVFIDYPELRPHFLEESPEPPSAVEEVRLTVVTEMVADALQVGIETAGRLAASQRYVELWGDCIDTTRASSSRLRAFSTNPGPWPTLTTRVATYDATPSLSPLTEASRNGEDRAFGCRRG